MCFQDARCYGPVVARCYGPVVLGADYTPVEPMQGKRRINSSHLSIERPIDGMVPFLRAPTLNPAVENLREQPGTV